MNVPSRPDGGVIDRRLLLWCVLISVIFVALAVFSAALVPFLLAGIFGYMGAPLVDRLERIGIGRAWSAALVLLALVLLILLGPVMLLPIFISQMFEAAQALPQHFAAAWNWLNEMMPGMTNESARDALRDLAGKIKLDTSKLVPSLSNAFAYLGDKIDVFLSFLATLIITPFATFYILRDWPQMLQRTHMQIPLRLRPAALNIASITDKVLSEFIRGQVTIMFVMAIIYSILLSIADVPYAVALGTLGGLLTIVPIVGFIIVFLLTMLVLAFSFESWLGIVWAVTALGIGTTLESFWLTPKLVGDRIGLGPVAVLFALTVMGAAFGFAGVLVALPVAAVAIALWRHFLPAEQETTPAGTA